MDEEQPKIEEISAANAKAFANLRDLTDGLKSVVEHEVFNNEEIPKRVEIRSSIQKD